MASFEEFLNRYEVAPPPTVPTTPVEIEEPRGWEVRFVSLFDLVRGAAHVISRIFAWAFLFVFWTGVAAIIGLVVLAAMEGPSP